MTLYHLYFLVSGFSMTSTWSCGAGVSFPLGYSILLYEYTPTYSVDRPLGSFLFGAIL